MDGSAASLIAIPIVVTLALATPDQPAQLAA